MTDLLDEHVPVFAVGGQREAHVAALRRGTDRKKLEALRPKVHPPDDEQPAFLYRIVHREQRREVAGLVVRLVPRSQIEAAEPGLVREREVPGIDFLQRRRIVNHDFI